MVLCILQLATSLIHGIASQVLGRLLLPLHILQKNLRSLLQFESFGVVCKLIQK